MSSFINPHSTHQPQIAHCTNVFLCPVTLYVIKIAGELLFGQGRDSTQGQQHQNHSATNKAFSFHKIFAPSLTSFLLIRLKAAPAFTRDVTSVFHNLFFFLLAPWVTAAGPLDTFSWHLPIFFPPHFPSPLSLPSFPLIFPSTRFCSSINTGRIKHTCNYLQVEMVYLC